MKKRCNQAVLFLYILISIITLIDILFVKSPLEVYKRIAYIFTGVLIVWAVVYGLICLLIYLINNDK